MVNKRVMVRGEHPTSLAGEAVVLSFDLLGFGAAESQVSLRDIRLSGEAVPIAFGDAVTLDEDTPATGNVLTNDSLAGLTVQAQVVEGPAHGSLSFAEDGSFTYRPETDYFGVDGFSYRFADNAGGSSNIARVDFTINPVDDAPRPPVYRSRDRIAITHI